MKQNLDTVLQVRPHQGRVEEQDHLSQRAGSAVPNVLQETIGLFAYSWSWTACFPPGPLGPSPQSCFPRAQPPACPGGQEQEPALGLAEFQKVPLCPSLQPLRPAEGLHSPLGYGPLLPALCLQGTR